MLLSHIDVSLSLPLFLKAAMKEMYLGEDKEKLAVKQCQQQPHTSCVYCISSFHHFLVLDLTLYCFVQQRAIPRNSRPNYIPRCVAGYTI